MQTPANLDIRSLISRVANYPSGDNCQPFRFVWDGSVLRIEYLPERGAHRLNPGHALSWMTLGMILESVHLAASEQGHSIEVQSLDEESIQVRFMATGRRADPMAASLSERQTDRRRFQGPSIDGEAACRRLIDSIPLEAGCRLRVLAPPVPAELLKYILDCDGVIWSDRLARKDLFRWMRLSKAEMAPHRLGSGDGMPQSLGIQAWERPLVMLVRALSESISFPLTTIAVLKSRLMLRSQVLSSEALVLLTLRGTAQPQLIDGGRVAMRAWLSLTSRRKSVHPLTLPAFGAFATQQGLWDPPLKESAERRFQGGQELLSRCFGLEPGERPFWMFRTGTPLPGEGPYRVARLKIDQILQVKGSF